MPLYLQRRLPCEAAAEGTFNGSASVAIQDSCRKLLSRGHSPVAVSTAYTNYSFPSARASPSESHSSLAVLFSTSQGFNLFPLSLFLNRDWRFYTRPARDGRWDVTHGDLSG